MDVSDSDLFELFQIKYGDPSTTGWSPKQRLKYGYYFPSDIYESIVKRLVTPDTAWIDVGGGRAIFPQNAALSRTLANTCKKLVAVDPSENINENPYAHKRVMSTFEEYETQEKFDLITFNMVAEHIDNPVAVVRKIHDILNPNGMVVIHTVNRYSPIPIITYLLPFSLHYKIKKLFWGGEEKDTFPVAYKMNTPKDLNQLFCSNQFEQVVFKFLDDLSIFHRFKYLSLLELWIWKCLKAIKLKYPEHNLLCIYRRKS